MSNVDVITEVIHDRLVSILQEAGRRDLLLDVSKLNRDGTGAVILEQFEASEMWKMIGDLPVISDNFPAYNLAMKILGAKYEAWNENYSSTREALQRYHPMVISSEELDYSVLYLTPVPETIRADIPDSRLNELFQHGRHINGSKDKIFICYNPWKPNQRMNQGRIPLNMKSILVIPAIISRQRLIAENYRKRIEFLLKDYHQRESKGDNTIDEELVRIFRLYYHNIDDYSSGSQIIAVMAFLTLKTRYEAELEQMYENAIDAVNRGLVTVNGKTGEWGSNLSAVLELYDCMQQRLIQNNGWAAVRRKVSGL
jgi:hypothetical protein